MLGEIKKFMQLQAKELQSEIDVMQQLMMMQATRTRSDSDEEEALTQKDVREYASKLKVSKPPSS